MTQVLDNVLDHYVRSFERAAAARNGGEPSWLRQLRRKGLDRFAETGFPTTRDEEWRFTSVRPIATTTFELAGGQASGVTADDVRRLSIGGEAPVQLTFVNGQVAPGLSRTDLPAGVRIESLASVIAHEPDTVEPYLSAAANRSHAFGALNAAFLGDGAFVSIPSGTVLDGWIQIVYLASAADAPAMMHPYTLVVVGEHSQVRLVETYLGVKEHRYFTNAVTDVRPGAASVVDHYKIQHESEAAYHIASMHLHAERDVNFSSHSISFGGALVRNDVNAVLAGEGIDCTLNGLYTADGQRVVDNHTSIDHAMPHCGSHEVYKGILGGHARAVFNGKIIVRPDAQKTDAKQTNKALLLTDDAQINTKPQLEIFANDVKCTHGAAVGQLDEDAIFYLRARGIGHEDARNLLVRAFAGDILNRVKLDALREDLERRLLSELPAA